MSSKTKKALALALKELMDEIPIDKITVKAIVEKCGVNRQTFYYHFKDIYDLLGWIYKTEVETTLADNRTYDTWQQGFYHIFQYASENKNFVMHTYHSIAREHLNNYLYSLVYKLLINVVNEVAEGMDVTEKDKAFIANFYKHGFTGLMLEWIQNNMKEDPRDIIERLSKLISGDIKKALEKHQ